MLSDNVLSEFGSVRGFDILRMLDFGDPAAAASIVKGLVRQGRVESSRLRGMLEVLYRDYAGDGRAKLPRELMEASDRKMLLQDPVAALASVKAAYAKAAEEVLKLEGLDGAAVRHLDDKDFSRVMTRILNKGRDFSYVAVASVLEPSALMKLLYEQQGVENDVFSEMSLRLRGFNIELQKQLSEAMRPRIESKAAMEGYLEQMREYDALPLADRLRRDRPLMPNGVVLDSMLRDFEERSFDQVHVDSEAVRPYRMRLGSDRDGRPVLHLIGPDSNVVASRTFLADGTTRDARVSLSSLKEKDVAGVFEETSDAILAALPSVERLDDVLSIEPLRSSGLYRDMYVSLERRFREEEQEGHALVYSERRDCFLSKLGADAASGAMTVKSADGEVFGTLAPVRMGGEVACMVYVPNRGMLAQDGTLSLVKVLPDEVGAGYTLDIDGQIPRDELKVLRDFLSSRAPEVSQMSGLGVRGVRI